MTQCRAHQIYRILLLICFSILLLTGFSRFFSNFYHFTAFWNYPFEWEWTDGDVYGQVDRLRKNLPLYMDLKLGLVYTSYTPLYPYLIKWVDSIFGVNTPVHARQINFIFLMGTVLLFFPTGRLLITGASLKLSIGNKNKAFISFLFLLLAFSIFTLRFAMFAEATWARTSMTSFFLGMSAFVATLMWERKRDKTGTLFIAAFLSAASVIAKQHGALICVAIALHFFFTGVWGHFNKIQKAWKPFVAYVVATFLFLTLATVYLEIINHGHFLEVTFLSMGKALNFSVKTESGLSVLSWPHSLQMLGDLYDGQRYYFWLTGIGCVYAALRKKWTVFHTAFLTLLLLTPYLTTSVGSGPSYYWPLWWVVCVLSVWSIFEMWALWGEQKLPHVQNAILLFCLFFLIQATHRSFRFRGDSGLSSPNAGVEESMVRSNAVIQKMVQEDPTREFLLDRYTGALFHAGKPFLVEACMLVHGYLGGAIDVSSWVTRIDRKEFYLITTNSWLDGIKEIREAIEKNYRKSAELSEALTNARIRPVVWVRR